MAAFLVPQGDRAVKTKIAIYASQRYKKSQFTGAISRIDVAAVRAYVDFAYSTRSKMQLSIQVHFFTYFSSLYFVQLSNSNNELSTWQ